MAQFTVINGRKMPEKSYDDWTWVDTGRLTGDVTITSKTAGFRLDRVLITPDAQLKPSGRGPDYRPNTAFSALNAAGVATKALNPFAVEISWKPVAGARYYNVHASDESDFTPGQSNLLYSLPVGTEKTVDWGLKPGSTTWYKVIAVDYDGTPATPSKAVAGKMAAIDVKTVEVEYESGTGATVEEDAKASGGKAVLLKPGKTYELKFTLPADDDYVIWHAFRGNNGRAVRCTVKLDGKKYLTQETYDLAALGGRQMGTEWVWSRYRFLWSKQVNGILRLSAGKHKLTITPNQPIHLDRMIITNDLSLVPKGKLCTF